MSIKNVVVWGGTGNLGPAIINALVKANFGVTILSRSAEHPAHIPRQAKIKQVHDFTSTSELTSALHGQDAIVSTVGPAAIPLQTHLVDAAVSAGVKLFLPSEFGGDTGNPNSAKLPVFRPKIVVQEHLQKQADEGKIGYTLVSNGPFLDWGLEKGLLLDDVTGRRPSRIFDGGDVRFSTTTLADVGKAVAGILGRPDEFKNKRVRIHSATVTQNQILAAAKKHAPSEKFETTSERVADVHARSLETLKSGEGDKHAAIIGLLYRSILDADYGNLYSDDDSKALGIDILDNEAVDALVGRIQKEKTAAN